MIEIELTNRNMIKLERIINTCWIYCHLTFNNYILEIYSLNIFFLITTQNKDKGIGTSEIEISLRFI